MRISRHLIVCILLASGPAVLAQSSSASLTANPLYEKNCAKCHGKTAEGRHFGGPSLVSEKVSAASPDDLSKIIADGKGRMPKYGAKLSAEEIDALVREIKNLPKK